jgi:hypothetical protein
VSLGALKNFRLGWSLFVLILLCTLSVLANRTIKVKNLKRATSSCANHSSFTGKLLRAEELPVLLTNSTEFADYIEQLYSGQAQRPATYCPGAKWSKTRTGVAFVGGGLSPTNTAPPEEVLIAFCLFDSHPLPFDHMHCLSLSSNRSSGNNIIERSCSNTRDMTNRLALALKQARNATVPYTQEAQSVLEVELQKRRRALGSAADRAVP